MCMLVQILLGNNTYHIAILIVLNRNNTIFMNTLITMLVINDCEKKQYKTVTGLLWIKIICFCLSYNNDL